MVSESLHPSLQLSIGRAVMLGTDGDQRVQSVEYSCMREVKTCVQLRTVDGKRRRRHQLVAFDLGYRQCTLLWISPSLPWRRNHDSPGAIRPTRVREMLWTGTPVATLCETALVFSRRQILAESQPPTRRG